MARHPLSTDLTRTNVVLSAAGDAPISRGQNINLISSQGALSYGSQTAGTLRQGGKYRYQTGSHVDSRGFSGILGVAREIKKDRGTLLYGLVGEYGKGSYDSYYGHMNGEGDSDYAGGALFVRLKENRGLYYEGSLRAGRTKADYSSRNFTGYEGTAVGYDTSSNYWGAHLGMGKVLRLAGDNELDVFLKYFYSRTARAILVLTTSANLLGMPEPQ
ncbi:hypothetical protein SAMN05216366_12153 [Selenomonas ruminantium]|uniref:Uncharacterized protein n=2 Tax=Selenomonas ruminantium TaxID=971 RepID=A0A1H0T5B7_SELRU|nr:hypothetical protein SAMN05216366_12153 [Selenomonas ruminantium]